MARIQEFYKGRRKRRNVAIIPFIILLAIFSLTLVMFYGMQKYAVISKDGVEVVLPFMETDKTTVDSEGHIIKVFDKVDTSIIFDEPDYSAVKAEAGADVGGLRAIFVPSENVNNDKLMEYAGRLSQGNALVLEMKPRSGITLWETHCSAAEKYGLSAANETTKAVPPLIAMLKEKGIYLVAQISCCIDETLPTRTTAYCIHTEVGTNYRDDVGTWLDAYNLELRESVAQMVRELYDLGFDEVVLADVAHPTLAEAIPLTYTREISTSRSTVAAVCGFAVGVANHLRDRTGALSIYIDSKAALVKPDLTTGQDAALLMKLYDRVYLRTDKYAYTYNVADIEANVELGNIYDRLVPVVENYIPQDNSSWVLIDVEEEEKKQ